MIGLRLRAGQGAEGFSVCFLRWVIESMSTESKMPEWLEPMAATLTEERFSGPDWLFERKFDGIRLLAYKRGGDVGLFSRNRLPQHLPAVSQRSRRSAGRRRDPRRRGDLGRPAAGITCSTSCGSTAAT